WATFGEAVPQGVAVDGLRVGALATQTDVKSQWADNSIRFAVVTVSVPVEGDYAITAGAASGASVTPVLPHDTWVRLTIGSQTFTATLPSVPSSDAWLSGSLVHEGRSTIAPVSSTDGSAHPFLRVHFDTRVYQDGVARVDVTVENVLDKAGATTVTYDVSIVVNGVERWNKARVEHFYLTR